MIKVKNPSQPIGKSIRPLDIRDSNSHHVFTSSHLFLSLLPASFAFSILLPLHLSTIFFYFSLHPQRNHELVSVLQCNQGEIHSAPPPGPVEDSLSNDSISLTRVKCLLMEYPWGSHRGPPQLAWFMSITCTDGQVTTLPAWFSL